MVKVDYSVLYPAALAVLVLSCLSSEGHPQRHNHHSNKVKQHMRNVSSFRCREPQLRLVQLKDLNITVRPEISYYPRATVLRRCDCATGYCSNPDHVCSANETAAVELVFSITNRVKGTDLEYITVSDKDHISCSCQPITSQIK
ncbi:hypothetical protein Cfor_07238 [Coptotermes formosanus]|jgi:hypothetical protein|uniref:Uncharacterized protein n=1 Tax=Coptotermes formosanus TaxID=36987 RepID=A0A6L2Q7N5_COPFO|nr:hypothetical protein Cfor_07238 [Coptotermes formosanus]